MRGVYDDYCCYLLNGRFNPAYAGSIIKNDCSRHIIKVQPRVCGEYVLMILTGAVERGSTPRMRGVFAGSLYHLIDVRFNPAYAGSISFALGLLQFCKVQPRVCGEYPVVVLSVLFCLGSTPRMRGVYLNLYQITSQIRFNPAYAGSIAPRQRSSQHAQVQPRVCGEYLRKPTLQAKNKGSTPRMRGVYKNDNNRLCQHRFNPAYAGSIQSFVVKLSHQ